MAFLVEEKELQGRKGFVITGYEGNARVLRIPEYLENASGEKLPVVEIAAHAFDGRGDLERVELPKSIRTLRAFSFFNCKNLREFLLYRISLFILKKMAISKSFAISWETVTDACSFTCI